MHSFSKLSVGGLSTSVEISRILSHLGGMRHLMIWVHCHPHTLSTPAVSWLVAAQCLWHLLKLFWCSGDTTARALLTDMSTRSREVQSTLVAGPWLGETQGLQKFIVSMVPFRLHCTGKAHRFDVCHICKFLVVFVMRLVFLHFFYGGLFKDVSVHLDHTVTSTMNAWISFTKIKSGLYVITVIS